MTLSMPGRPRCASLEREPRRLAALRENVRQPRALADVATDMLILYGALVGNKHVTVAEIPLSHA